MKLEKLRELKRQWAEENKTHLAEYRKNYWPSYYEKNKDYLLNNYKIIYQRKKLAKSKKILDSMGPFNSTVELEF